MSEPELSDVLAELRELRAEVITLRAQVDQQSPPEPVSPPPTTISNDRKMLDVDGTDAVSRRHALRTAGMVAAGALAGGAALVAAAGPAAATGPTTFNADGSAPGVTATSSTSYVAIRAYAYTSVRDAIAAEAFGGGSNAITGTANADAGCIGVQGEATAGKGVVGISQSGAGAHGTTTSGTGVEGYSSSGVGTWGTSDSAAGVRGSSTTNYGVRGDSISSVGGYFQGTTGVWGSGQTRSGQPGIGLWVSSDHTAIRINPQGSAPPSLLSSSFSTGDLNVDGFGTLWYCTGGGTPGTWRTLSASTGAGSFYAVTPSRVYDSRLSTYPLHGALTSLQNRTLSVANSFDVNGALVDSDFVPAGATAVFANVTIVDTVGAGYLAINPGGITTVAASTINWSATGQILANGISLTLNSTRQITVVNGSGGATQFIIDVTGYWM